MEISDKNRGPTLGSLFDGIGGFPLCAVQNGIRPVWASEIDPFPVAVTHRRFPDMLHVGDITKLHGANLPPVDIITGGSPCQDLSVAGRRTGLQGARSGLFLEQIRIIKEMREADRKRGRTAEFLRPRFLVWENVPGAFYSAAGEDFRIILQESIGIVDSGLYVPRPPGGKWKSAGAILGDQCSLAWRVLDAQYWGVPQRRKRIFLVADFGGHTAPQILFEQESVFRHFTPGRGTGKNPAAAVERSVGATGWEETIEEVGDITINQQNAARDLHNAAAAFSAGAGASAGSIGYGEEVAPTLKGTASGNSMPSVLCLNDQGGRVMHVSRNKTGTLLSETGGHQPVILDSGHQEQRVYENHGKDARYNGPQKTSPTIVANHTCGLPLVENGYCASICGNTIGRKPDNGGNGIGIQMDISYTLTATDRHAVFCRQRSDQLKTGAVASTQSARQYKDVTDIIGEHKEAGVYLVRRMTPLECERLQGFPDGWTNIPKSTDAKRYRALGNSVAIPCVTFVMRGIALILKGGTINQYL